MAQAGVERRPGAPWLDRIFEAIPLTPPWVGVALAAGLIGLYLLTMYASGELAGFLQRDIHWWQDRDARLGLVLALLVGYLPVARRFETLGTQRNLEKLRTTLPWPAGAFERAASGLQEIDPSKRRRAGLIALLAVPVTALSIDRDPTLYFSSYYWGAAQLWNNGIGALISWNAGVLVHMIVTHTRRFAELGRRVPAVDLLDLTGFAPFARQGLRSALPGLIFLALMALNLADQAFLWAIGVLGSLAFGLAGAAMLLSVRGVHSRIREAKRAELARVNAAIQGDHAALGGSSIEAWADGVELRDLLAYRGFVESVREWPFEQPLRLRFLLYVAIPLGSWLGGALVERLLESALA